MRTGDASTELTVLLVQDGQAALPVPVHLPAGATRLPLPLGTARVSLVPDGDTYVVR